MFSTLRKKQTPPFFIESLALTGTSPGIHLSWTLTHGPTDEQCLPWFWNALFLFELGANSICLTPKQDEHCNLRKNTQRLTMFNSFNMIFCHVLRHVFRIFLPFSSPFLTTPIDVLEGTSLNLWRWLEPVLAGSKERLFFPVGLLLYWLNLTNKNMGF